MSEYTSGTDDSENTGQLLNPGIHGRTDRGVMKSAEFTPVLNSAYVVSGLNKKSVPLGP